MIRTGHSLLYVGKTIIINLNNTFVLSNHAASIYCGRHDASIMPEIQNQNISTSTYYSNGNEIKELVYIKKDKFLRSILNY